MFISVIILHEISLHRCWLGGEGQEEVNEVVRTEEVRGGEVTSTRGERYD